MRNYILWSQKFCVDTYSLLFGIDCLFIMLFTKQVFVFPKLYIVYFTKHQRRKSSNRLILVIFYIMDTQMLAAINYIINVSNMKVNNAGESNWDKESVEATLKEM